MEILGLIDAIEATILDSPRMPFTDKIVIREKKILEMLSKLRMVAQTDGEAARRAVKGEPPPRIKAMSKKRLSREPAMPDIPAGSPVTQHSVESILAEARAKAEAMQQGADEYAKDILNQLLIVTTKIQRTVENGKTRLKKKTQGND
ncbi:hypothetical protein ACFL5G_03765 [Candidatus Margulisiibacteriota bacterium]